MMFDLTDDVDLMMFFALETGATLQNGFVSIRQIDLSPNPE
jgi:hypothetical protein